MSRTYLHAAATLCGRRAENEDAVWTAELSSGHDGIIGLVADGMGGLKFGAAAANAVVSVFQNIQWDKLDRSHLGENNGLAGGLSDAVSAAHHRVCEIPVELGGESDAGVAMCAALLWRDRYCVVHVGDTRCYYVNSDGIRVLTEDQSLAQQGYPNVLTNSLGDPQFTGPVITPVPPLVGVLEESCTFVIVSDGVHTVLDENLILRMVSDSGNVATLAAARSIVTMAYERGSLDNVSCALLSSGACSHGRRRSWWTWR